jgi:DNA polymerase-4
VIWLCRECDSSLRQSPDAAPSTRCPACRSPRLIFHSELETLSVAHLDCDAFYASVEKRDDPSLANRPVIVGGGHRGVVSAACYVARTFGVRSAMPMYKALELCPHAAVVRPNMEKYSRVGRQIREMMQAATPLVEPLSIDEAFLDLTGLEAVHGAPAAVTLVRLVRRIEREAGVTVSVGLSYNKFLAKFASELDKPRGFACVGAAEAVSLLAPRSVGAIWGVGPAMLKRLTADGLARIGDLQQLDRFTLARRYGGMGDRLYHFARGIDDRRVTPYRPAKSVSAETTFDHDVADLDEIERRLRPLADKVASRLVRARVAAGTVTLKLKTADFRTITRQRQLERPTQDGEQLWRTSALLLQEEGEGARYRLIGVGGDQLFDQAVVDSDLFEQP